MIEILKHTFGLCGEGHPSIVWLIGPIVTAFYFLKHNIKWCWKQGCDYCKAKLSKVKNKN